MIEGNLFVPQGWQCPVCKRVYSPDTSMCAYCGGEAWTINTATTYPVSNYDVDTYTQLIDARKNLQQEE